MFHQISTSLYHVLNRNRDENNHQTNHFSSLLSGSSRLEWNSDDDDEEDYYSSNQTNRHPDESIPSSLTQNNNKLSLQISLIQAPMISASARSLHCENFQIRQLFSKMKVLSRIVSNVLEELRLSVVHDIVSSSDEEDDDENEETKKSSSSSSFKAKDWMKSVQIGGLVCPVALYRTSLVIPAYVSGLPPKTELPCHHFLQVHFDKEVIEEDEQNNDEQKAKAKNLIAHLVSLIAFVASQIGLSKSIVKALAKSCMKNAFFGKSSSASAKHNNNKKIPHLLFVQPRIEDLFAVFDHQGDDDEGDTTTNDDKEEGNGADADEPERKLLFSSSTSIAAAPMSPLTKLAKAKIKNENNYQKEESIIFEHAMEAIFCEEDSCSSSTLKSSCISFVVSAFSSFLKSSTTYNMKKFNLKRENERVGAFGNFFEITEAREALRYLSMSIEKELLAESTNNSIHIDLFDTYVAAAIFAHHHHHQKNNHSSPQIITIVKILKSPFFSLPSDLQRKLSKKSKLKELANGVQKFVEVKPSNNNITEEQDEGVLSSIFVSSNSPTTGSHLNLNLHQPFEAELYDLLLNCLQKNQNHQHNNERENLHRRAERIKIELVYGEHVRKGIPPSLRLSIWAALLELNELEIETEANKEEARLIAFSASPCDRQVLLDLPRCHPSDPLMKSSSGQLAAHRIVRLWLHYSTKREKELLEIASSSSTSHNAGSIISGSPIHYWQGIDSMAATMLSTSKNELLCAHVMERIVEKFVPDFAASNAIRARVGRLAGIVRFHDPFAAAHLDEACGVQIDHFALPWILTAFAHVFPLAQTCRLWDALLLHPEPLTLLLNFTVAVITASRLQFLNAPDLSSSLLLLRQSAQNVVSNLSSSAKNVSGDVDDDEKQKQKAHKSVGNNNESSSSSPATRQVLFSSVLTTARKFASVSPPYCSSTWDKLDCENCFDSIKRKEEEKNPHREPTTSDEDTNESDNDDGDKFDKIGKSDLIDDGFGNHNGDEEDDDMMNMPIKRHVPSVRLCDIEDYDTCRWKNVIVVLAHRNRNKLRNAALAERKRKEQEELERKLTFVVGPRVQFLVGADEDYSQAQSVSSIRNFIRKGQQQQPTKNGVASPSSSSSMMTTKERKQNAVPAALVTSPVTKEEATVSNTSSLVSNRFIVVVVSSKKDRAIDVALQLAGEGIEHVATLDLK